jgi:hypothetical protein
MLLKKKLETGMSDIMATHNNTIAEFKAEINEIMQKLQSRGVGALDLLGQLFHVYTACCTNETPFFRYVEGLGNRYIDGDITRTTKMLMEKAETKYEELKDQNKFETGNNKGLQASEADVVALPVQFTFRLLEGFLLPVSNLFLSFSSSYLVSAFFHQHLGCTRDVSIDVLIFQTLNVSIKRSFIGAARGVDVEKLAK